MPRDRYWSPPGHAARGLAGQGQAVLVRAAWASSGSRSPVNRPSDDASPGESGQSAAASVGLGDADRGALLRVLAESQERGFIGPGSVEPHLQRALDMASLIPSRPRRALDLGSGGGLPGLPLALAFPDTEWVLLDGSLTRAAFLSEAVAALHIDDRVQVVAERAELAGRSEDLRASFDLVVARSFGPPATTAECAAPFLAVGGLLIVAEPPGSIGDRWVPDGLEKLGLRLVAAVAEPSAVAMLEQHELCPAGYPRRTGVPAKRPLF